MDNPSIIALIPARSGSVRVPDKNIRVLSGHPLMAYTIVAAQASGVFDKIVVSTDSEKYATIALHYGAEVPFLRPAEMAASKSPDFEWINYTLRKLMEQGQSFECFSILRPTSPLRTTATIQRAWDIFRKDSTIDSLRAVELAKQHPGKMWVVHGARMSPLLLQPANQQPWHSQQYASLPEVYVQNASLEIAWRHVILKDKNISGSNIAPFITSDLEGFDVNDERDWRDLETLLKNGKAQLPPINIKPATI